MTHAASDNGDELEVARQTIERQAHEIASLRGLIAATPFVSQLGEALTLAAAAGTVAAPIEHSRLLDLIVETASQVINAEAASLYLIDEEAQELIFEVTRGGKAAEVKKLRLPVGHGVAGLVAMTGQPMAVSDAAADPRQAADIAERVGYHPNSILAVPLMYDDQIIGVLEMLDKVGRKSFTPSDMAALGLFANQAAVAIQQSQAHANITNLVVGVLRTVGAEGVTGEGRGSIHAQALAAALAEDATYQRSLELARLIHDIAQQGDRELLACREILRVFATYLRSKPEWVAGSTVFTR